MSNKDHAKLNQEMEKIEMTCGPLADFTDGDFAVVGPFPHHTQMSVMPVMAVRDDHVRAVGTCFSISSQGLVLTARHVIADALRFADDSPKWPNDTGISVLWIGGGEAGGLLPVSKVFVSDPDVAVMYIRSPTHRDTGKPVRMPALILGTRVPKVGEPCVGIGYHTMEWQLASDGIHTHNINQRYSASRGHVREVHIAGRDSSLMTFPCFRTDCKIVGGMSGGPIIDRHGNAVGIISSSIDLPEGESSISYASFAGVSLLVVLDAADESDGGISKRFLYDFVEGKSVLTDQQFVVRSDQTVSGRRSLTLGFEGLNVTNHLAARG